ncbi:MAG: leucine--tRNA ligase [Bacteroidetes bacterium]|nr:leucine--tRNA ligase [Bacteroidota bacterium]
MEYNFIEIEKKWQDTWNEKHIYQVKNEDTRPAYYVLDMFPYPSGAGLHVGHPLGYIASDIFARYKRLQGFNVLHPMGYDAFGLPAEQYAIEHGIPPAVSTAQNIKNFRKQLDRIGFSYDWSREIKTSDPQYYKWTQWIFLQLFKSFYNRQNAKAEPIEKLVAVFEKEGNIHFPCPGNEHTIFTPEMWNSYDEKIKMEILMNYRLAYCGYGEVNWCEGLGTVLANDEVMNGLSERGGFPVERKTLRQWYLRITEYADRLLEGLLRVDFSDSMKEMQSNWIGKSTGAEISFQIHNVSNESVKVYTTRPDTIFGVDFLVLAPEHILVSQITTPDHQKEVDEYKAYMKSRSDRERQAEKKITGCFTGAFAVHPFSDKLIPVWISEYVLAGYGTGAIMAVPCGDERDFKFAQHFNIPITNIIGREFNGEMANDTKDAILENSDFLNGVKMRDAAEMVLQKLAEKNIGKAKIQYKMRDAAFSRQRYWGEPFPIIWQDDIAYPMNENELPLLLPPVDELKPGPHGQGPLANNREWIENVPGNGIRESSTMPGYAGSSWYFLRYMDPHNNDRFCDKKISNYWGNVDLYIGGTEHAVGHLLYSRMWTKFLFDLDLINFDEPFKRLLNQGMIQGSSRFVYKLIYTIENVQPSNLPVIFISKKYADHFLEKNEFDETGALQLGKIVNDYFKKTIEPINIFIQNITPIHTDVNMVNGFELNMDEFKKWRNHEYGDACFILDDGKYICGAEVEKMSKSKFNTINPDDLVLKYGADTFRLYEMFLGPVEQSKPWDTKGIEGVHRFLKKLWRLFFDESKGSLMYESEASSDELKILHTAIKKVKEDTERFSFNTAVSAFMIAVNELTTLKCHNIAILKPLIILLAPYAPHIAEELYQHVRLYKQENNFESILDETLPVVNEKYLMETSKNYPVSINGKLRTTISISLEAGQQGVETIILSNEVVKKWLDGKPHKKIIYVKNKMINIVI